MFLWFSPPTKTSWHNARKAQRALVPFKLSLFIIHYNVKHFKESYGRPESHSSLILNCQLCACVIRISGIPQLQVIRMERLYGYE